MARIHLLRVAVLFVLLVAWQVAGSFPSLRFAASTPTEVAREFSRLALDGELFQHASVTAMEAGVGFLIGTTAGTLLGLATWYSPTTASVASPFVTAAGAAPVFAFAPLLIVWFGVGFPMKVALAAFSTLLVAFSHAFRGASTISKQYVEILQVFGATRHQIFIKAVVPGSLDWVLGSLRLNVGIAIIGAFIGEFISAEAGLGYLITRASSLYNVGRALAAALALVIIALVADATAAWVERHRHRVVQILSVHPRMWQS